MPNRECRRCGNTQELRGLYWECLSCGFRQIQLEIQVMSPTPIEEQLLGRQVTIQLGSLDNPPKSP